MVEERDVYSMLARFLKPKPIIITKKHEKIGYDIIINLEIPTHSGMYTEQKR